MKHFLNLQKYVACRQERQKFTIRLGLNVNYFADFVCVYVWKFGLGVGVCVCGGGGCVRLPCLYFRGLSYENTPIHRGLYTFRGPKNGSSENVSFYWLKTPKTSCFTILGGSALRGPQRTSNLTLYMRTYESSEV